VLSNPLYILEEYISGQGLWQRISIGIVEGDLPRERNQNQSQEYHQTGPFTADRRTVTLFSCNCHFSLSCLLVVVESLGMRKTKGKKIDVEEARKRRDLRVAHDSWTEYRVLSVSSVLGRYLPRKLISLAVPVYTGTLANGSSK